MAHLIRERILEKLIGRDGFVFTASLPELEKRLLLNGFPRVKSMPFGYGFHLFYRKDDTLIRVKTDGNPPGNDYQAREAHLTVSMAPGGDAFEDELGKYLGSSGSIVPNLAPLKHESRKHPRWLAWVLSIQNDPAWDAHMKAVHYLFPVPSLSIRGMPDLIEMALERRRGIGHA